jgi:hypothetical protein
LAVTICRRIVSPYGVFFWFVYYPALFSQIDRHTGEGEGGKDNFVILTVISAELMIQQFTMKIISKEKSFV